MSFYHFTDNVRLPWILATGELRPQSERVMGGYPQQDFLWATRDSRGSRTATILATPEHYRSGKVAMVRITLPEDPFESWPAITQRFPEWTAEHIAKLNSSGGAMGDDPKQWVCTDVAMPRSSFEAIEWRTWRDNTWRPIASEKVTRIEDPQTKMQMLGVDIGHNPISFSRATTLPNGRRAYTVRFGRLDEK